MTTQMPSPCRMVLYQIRPQIYRPAVIVEGHGLDSATLIVFTVPEWDSTNDVVRAHLSAQRGDGVGQWNWPPYVPPVTMPPPAPSAAEAQAAMSAPLATGSAGCGPSFSEDETDIRKAEHEHAEGVREMLREHDNQQDPT